jgi:hypothetical protein
MNLEIKRYFWLIAVVICLLPVIIMTIHIKRPFTGLHSWAQADCSWWARSHLIYGLDYTKGLCTPVVGEPPTENPIRYLNHPQLPALLNAAVMRIVGINEAAVRVVKIITTVAALLLFIKILQKLSDEKTALLAGFLYTIFPVTCYFGAGDFGLGGWVAPVGLYAVWCYLVLIKALNNGPTPKTFHKWALAASLFLVVQLSWAGFFYAFAIGSHYVLRCIIRKKFPQKDLLAILIIAPIAGLIIVFSILARADNWNLARLWELYKWRSARGETEQFLWTSWLAKLWEYMATNYTRPVLITAILYLTIGQAMVFKAAGPSEYSKSSRRFPQLWLFLAPGALLLLVFKGLVWHHQYWQQSLSPFIAIAAALGVMLLADILKKLNRWLCPAGVTILICVFVVSCSLGTRYYYKYSGFSPAVVEICKMLNKRIPPDKKLLSFEPFVTYQHKARGIFYQPEVAWYLDRDIIRVTSAEKVEILADTGMFPYYLIPVKPSLAPIIGRLQKLYEYQAITSKKGMTPYLIFDLSRKSKQ